MRNESSKKHKQATRLFVCDVSKVDFQEHHPTIVAHIRNVKPSNPVQNDDQHKLGGLWAAKPQPVQNGDLETRLACIYRSSRALQKGVSLHILVYLRPTKMSQNQTIFYDMTTVC